PRLFALFTLFIFSSGAVHLLEAVVFWHPVYRLSGVAKLATAFVSLSTALALLRAAPSSLSLPDIARLNEQLQREITERKQRERERDQFFQLSLDALCVFDLSQGRFTMANEALYTILGSGDHASLRGRSFTSLIAFDELERWEEIFARLGRGEVIREVSLTLGRGQEEGRTLSWTFSPSVDEDRVYATARDITPAKLEEARSERLERQLLETQKLESLGLIAGGIAHDFNNLLVGVVGNAALAQEVGDDPELVAECLEQITNAGQRATRLCDQMLAYSGRGRFQVATLHVDEVLREEEEFLKRAVAQGVSLQLQYEARAEPLRIKADLTQVRQVLMNLVTNAAEAMEGGRGSVSITSGEAQLGPKELSELLGSEHASAGRFATLTVRDDGEGMDAQTMSRIFDPFFTTRFTGRGLGLAAVIGIVRGHRGGIQVSSAPGEGASFVAYFPLDEGEERVEERAPARVLIVDDEEHIRSMVHEVMQAQGYETTLARSTEEALRILAHTDRFDAIVVDMSLSGAGGGSMLGAFTEHAGGAPLVLLSGFTRDEVLVRVEEYAVAGLVSKPIDSAALARTIQEVIEEDYERV
ncbi:MAG: ATP-binding protein, partial [Myxococcota bacterium]